MQIILYVYINKVSVLLTLVLQTTVHEFQPLQLVTNHLTDAAFPCRKSRKSTHDYIYTKRMCKSNSLAIIVARGTHCKPFVCNLFTTVCNTSYSYVYTVHKAYLLTCDIYLIICCLSTTTLLPRKIQVDISPCSSCYLPQTASNILSFSNMISTV